ncbi:glycosyltransferase family 2 protein [Sediminibacterium sp. TEGAF015]|uniref:glycosyltransferase family 2 protein n=1 Tax=Sediminibacterium sp. TEGAF015 TaxID=575378 RepID=UPI002230847A|nr:glycosyltransferase family 2 protein [Sediminibacterium sp. TEGAF015]
MSSLLTIIIVNYRVYHHLGNCLESIQGSKHAFPVDIIVVDNAYSPEDQALLAEKYPTVQWLSASNNIGFAKANNWALQQVETDFVLFLNPDTLIAETVLQKTIDYLNQHPEVGTLGVQMRNIQGIFLPESKREIPSIKGSFFKMIGLADRFSHSAFFNSYALGQLHSDGIYSVPVLAGAFMMMPTTIAKQVGGFDDSFFMYGEDIDISLRILELGKENHYLGTVVITHVKGASSKQNPDYLNHFYGSMKIFLNKYPHLYGGIVGITLLKFFIETVWLTSRLTKKYK